ncbi:MAG: hypothetical protein ACLP8X_36375 [Streptosporangiaceae bacterium]
MPVPGAHDRITVWLVTPEPPDVATGTETHGWCVLAAVPGWPPATPAADAADAATAAEWLARAKYPVVTTVTAISAAAVPFDQRRTCRRPRARARAAGGS